MIGSVLLPARAGASAYRAIGLAAPLPPVALAGIGVVVLLVLLAGWRVARTSRTMRQADRQGRSVSAQHTGANLVTSFSREGGASDPLNVKIIGTSGQLAAAFTAAGWYRADEIDLVTSVRISFDSVLGRKYSTAPVSSLYLYGREEDFAFERPGSSVRERDHVRLWNTGTTSAGGRPVWIGGATHDIKVEISQTTHLPTHKIAPNVDDERQNVLDTLIESAWVIDDGWEAGFGKPTEQRNSLGDSYHTDGRRAVITLARVSVLAPVVTHVRGPLALRLAEGIGVVLSTRLPKEARVRAVAHRAERVARERAKALIS